MRVQFCLLTLLSLLGVSAYSQNAPSCPAAPAVLTPSEPNIFNARQEQDLGDAYAQIAERQFRFVNDPEADAYLEKIGQKLLAVLPPIEFKFRYRIIDSEQVNAFSIAGGHIYVTRKLIAAAANEDELAGVVAHEIGHILTHVQAIRTTEDLDDRLHINSVGDRADIFDKLQRLRNTYNPFAWYPSSLKGEESADAVGVYAPMKAGYMASAYAQFWDRIAQTKGKSGSAVGDFFHITRPNELRLKAILKNTAAIPAGCVATKPTITPEFLAWRAKVVADPVAPTRADADDKPTHLKPPLRSDLTRVRFSLNGKYALAQDRSAIFVLGRSPLRLLFQIDAEGADPASFSPDSTRISFSTPSLHVESWDVASGQLAGAYEVVTFKPCIQHLLSPDGRAMACILNTTMATDRKLGLTIWNVETGDVIVKKDDAFPIPMFIGTNFGYGFTANANGSFVRDAKLRWPAVRWAFTPDGSRLVANREPTTVVYDMGEHSFVKAEGAVAKLNRRPFALIGNDRIAIDNWDDPQKSALYSFPEGKELKRIAMGDQEMFSMTHGDYVGLTPMKDVALGVLDINTGQVPFTLPNDVLDIDDKTVLMETGEGGVALTSQGLVPGAKDSENLDLPVSELGEITASAVSPDGKYLALSNQSRCAIWNAETGDRIFYVRPFSGGYFDDQDRFYADLPKYRGQDHAQVMVDPHLHKAVKLAYAPAEHTQQMDDILVDVKSLEVDPANAPKTSTIPGLSSAQAPAEDPNRSPLQNSDLEIRDVHTNGVLWGRHFPHEAPVLVSMGRADELLLTYDVAYTGLGGAEVKAHPELATELKAIKEENHGFLVEVVDKKTGKYRRGVVADVRHNEMFLGLPGEKSAWFYKTATVSARAFGDFALVESQRGSAAVYRFSTGVRVGEVFGDIIGMDAASGLFCIANHDNELIVYDAATVKERKRFAYASQVRLAEFLPATRKLLVLTADQKVHIANLETSSLPPSETAAAQPASPANP